MGQCPCWDRCAALTQHRRAAATSRPDETVAPRRFLSPAETCLGSDSPCRKPTGVGVGRRPGYADPRHVDGRREHALPTDPGTRLPDPSAEPGAALLAPAARPTRLDLAEGAPRRRARLRRAPLRPHSRHAAPPRRDRRRRDPCRRRPLVHPVVSGRGGPRARGGHRRPRARLTAAGRRAAIALLLGAAVAGQAAAQLRLEAESQVGDVVTLRLRATNAAAEAVHDVVPEVVYRHRTVAAERVAAIAPGAAHEWRTALPAPPGPGTFPATIRLRYTARDGQARSELLVHLVRTPGAPPPEVRSY